MTNGARRGGWLELCPSGLKLLPHIHCNNECIDGYTFISTPRIYATKNAVWWPFFTLSLWCRGSFHRYHNNKMWEEKMAVDKCQAALTYVFAMTKPHMHWTV